MPKTKHLKVTKEPQRKKKLEENENHDDERKFSSDSNQSDFLAKKPTKVEKDFETYNSTNFETKVEEKCEIFCEKKESEFKEIFCEKKESEFKPPKDSDCLLKKSKDDILVYEYKRGSEDVLDINDLDLIKSTHYKEYPESDDSFNHAHKDDEYTKTMYKHRKPHIKRDPLSSRNVGRSTYNTYKTLSKDAVNCGDKHYPITTYSVNKDYSKANGRLYSKFIHDEKVIPKGEKYSSDALNEQFVLKKMHKVKYESNDSDMYFEDLRKFPKNKNAKYNTFHTTNLFNAAKNYLTTDASREKMKKIHNTKKNFKKKKKMTSAMDRETKSCEALSDDSDILIESGKMIQNGDEVSHYPRKKSFREKTGKRIDKNLLKKSGVLEVFEKIEHVGSEISSSIEFIKSQRKKRRPSSICTEDDSSLEKIKHASLYAGYPKYKNFNKRNNDTFRTHEHTVFSEQHKSNNRKGKNKANYSRKYKSSSDQSSYEELQKENLCSKNTIEKQLNSYYKHINVRNQKADKHKYKKFNRISKKAYENNNKDYNLIYPDRRQIHLIHNKHSGENISKPTFNQKRYARFSNNHNSSKFKEHNQNDSVIFLERKHSHYKINSDSSVDVQEYKTLAVNKSYRPTKSSKSYKCFSRPANLTKKNCSSSHFCSDSEIDDINKYKSFTKIDNKYLRFGNSDTNKETSCDSTCNENYIKCADTEKIRNKKVRRKSVPYNEIDKKFRNTPISTLSKDFSTFSKNSYARRKTNSKRCKKKFNVEFFQKNSTSSSSAKSFVCKSCYGKKHGKISHTKRKKKYNNLKKSSVHRKAISRYTFSDCSTNVKTKQKLNSRNIESKKYSNYNILTSTCDEWSTESDCVENKCIQNEIESSCEEQCKRNKKNRIPSRFQSIKDLTEEKFGCTYKEDSKNTRSCQEKHTVTHFKRPKSKKKKLNYRVNQNTGFKDQRDRIKKNMSTHHVSDSSCTSQEPQPEQRHANEEPNVKGACMNFPLFLLTMIANLVGVD